MLDSCCIRAGCEKRRPCLCTHSGKTHAQTHTEQVRPSRACDTAVCNSLATLGALLASSSDLETVGNIKITIRSFTRFCQILTLYPILLRPFGAPNVNQASSHITLQYSGRRVAAVGEGGGRGGRGTGTHL